jgi:NADPH:quinone reductase-like Zn-dependent oxidoreductase
MRAALIRAFIEPIEVLELADVPEPSGPAAAEVLVNVEYAPINMNDPYLIQGAFPVRPSLPSIVGNEGVGHASSVSAFLERPVSAHSRRCGQQRCRLGGSRRGRRVGDRLHDRAAKRLR